MADTLIPFAVNNVLVSGALAILAWVVHRRGTRPHLAHLLWLLVTLKLVTPPVFTVPLIPIAATAHVGAASEGTRERHGARESDDEPRRPAPADGLAAADPAAVTPATRFGPLGLDPIVRWTLLGIWGAGSLALLIWSLVRIARFQRLLNRASRPAPEQVQRLAATTATRLGLCRAAPTQPDGLSGSARPPQSRSVPL